MEQTLRGLLPEELQTDCFPMDAQHEEIFSRIEALRNDELAAMPAFIDRIADLLAYLDGHFATEARIAAEAGLDFTVHAQTHVHNFRLLNKAMNEVKRGSMEPRSFVRYIDYWFEHHINEFDKPFARSLQRHLADSQQRAAVEAVQPAP